MRTRKPLEKNGVAKENLKNRQIRTNLEKIISEECANSGAVPKNTYNIFVGVKNTGEQVTLPDTEWVVEKICKRFENENNCRVFVNYKSITIRKNA